MIFLLKEMISFNLVSNVKPIIKDNKELINNKFVIIVVALATANLLILFRISNIDIEPSFKPVPKLASLPVISGNRLALIKYCKSVDIK